MTVLTEKLPHAGGYLVKEFDRDFNRESVTLLTGQAYPAGAVLGKITASGKYTLYDNAAADGTEVAAAILYDDADATAADVAAVAHVRGPAIVTAAELTFDAGQNAAAQTAALADLAAIGLIAR